MRTPRAIFDFILIASFCASLLVPLLWTHNRSVSDIEKRDLALLPEFSLEVTALKQWPSKFEKFFNDHFGFRDELAQAYYLLGYFLHTSATSRVLIGKDGWLFYQEGNTIEDYRGNLPLTKDELQRWKTVLENKYKHFADRGIYYLFIIAPNKHTIYPEYLPSRINKVSDHTQIDQFLEYMKDSPVPILDLRPVLLQAKSIGQLYYKTDTHWNDLGVSVAQAEIMRHLQKSYLNIQPIDYSKNLRPYTIPAGDLAAMMNLKPRLDETGFTLTPALTDCNQQALGYKPGVIAGYSRTCQKNAPSALILGDSFSMNLVPYLAHYFSDTMHIFGLQNNEVYVWGMPGTDDLDKYIDAYLPNIVIEEMVERKFKSIPHLNYQDEKLRVAMENLFNSSQSVYRLANDSPFQENIHTKIMPANPGYKLHGLDNDPQILLPKFKTNPDKQYLIRIELDTPQTTPWRFFYMTEDKPYYHEDNSLIGGLEQGINVIYIRIDGKLAGGDLRFDPGQGSGEYWLKTLEIREADRAEN